MSLRYLVLLAAVLTSGCDNRVPEALGTLEWERINGRAIASEVIQEIYVREGDLVERGQPLLKLDSSLIDAQIRQLEATVESSRWLLKERETGPRAQEIAEARARLEAAQSDVVTTKLELERQRDLVQKKYSTERDLEQAQNRHDEALSRRDAAREQLDLLETGTRVEQIEQARAALAQAQAQLDYQQALRERYTVRAERAGRVDNLVFKLGDKPAANAVVVTLLAGEQPYARVYVPEPWRGRVNPGDRLTVRIDGVDGTFTGLVRKVSADPAFTPYYALTERDRSRLSYLAELDLQEAKAGQLAAGLPVQVDLPAL